MLEALGVGPRRKMRVPLLNEAFLEAEDVGSGMRIACGNGAADAWVAAFKGDFADMETDYAAKFSAEELVFPEWWNAVELQSGAETQAGFGDSHAGKPIADGLERGGGDDGGAVGDEIVGDASRVVANHDGVTKEFAEPFGGGSGVSRKSECCARDIAAIIWSCESDAGEAGLVRGANQMPRRDARCADQLAVEGIDGPGAVELQAAGGAYGGGGDFYRVE